MNIPPNLFQSMLPSPLEADIEHDDYHLLRHDDETHPGQASHQHEVEPYPSTAVIGHNHREVFRSGFSLGSLRTPDGQLTWVLIQNPGYAREVNYEAELMRQPLLAPPHEEIEDLEAPVVQQPPLQRGTLALTGLKVGSIAVGGAALAYGLATLGNRNTDHSQDSVTKALLLVVVGARLILCGCDAFIPNVWRRNRL